MAVGFRFVDAVNWPSGVDLDDLYVRAEYFQQGGLWSWGWGTNGLLGDNTSTPKSSPVQTVAGGTNWKQAGGGYGQSAAIKSDGTLWNWGYNFYGNLGDNTMVTRLSPVQTISGGTNWKQVSSGIYHTAAIKTDGTLWTWGYNSSGQLGDNTIANRSSPVQTVAGGATWKQVACGGYHTAAIKNDGTLWAWGMNSSSQLGDSTVVNKSSPIQITGGGTTNWKQVSCGLGHTGAIKTDGSLWLCGSNGYGQIGNNLGTSSYQVQTTPGGTNWKQVSCGGSSTMAIKTDGSLWAWGQNSLGMLALNNITNQVVPVRDMTSGTNWKSVATGESSMVAIKTDGTLWTCGASTTLGDNTQVNKSSPVQTVAGGTNWKSIPAGYFNENVMAITIME